MASNRGPGSSPVKASRSFLLPLVTVWLLAIVVLAGLIFWGEDSKRLSQKVRKQAHIASQQPEEDPKEVLRHTSSSEDTANSKHSEPQQENQVPTVAVGPNPPEYAGEPTIAETRESLPADSNKPHQDSQLTIASAWKEIESLPPAPPPPEPAEPAPKAPVARVAIIIDDFGQSLEAARKFLRIPLPITFSVLPHEAHSREIAELAYSHSREVLLHIPMEPREYPRIKPGRGALLLSMSDSTVQKTLKTALDFSPRISGVNNHMGSRFTEDSARMRIFLAELQNRGLYFLDSCTSPGSVGFSLARELNMPHMRRDIFLDHSTSEESVRSQVDALIRKAKIQGTAVAIGHPHEVTLRVLLQEAERFQREGIAVVSARDLVM